MAKSVFGAYFYVWWMYIVSVQLQGFPPCSFKTEAETRHVRILYFFSSSKWWNVVACVVHVAKKLVNGSFKIDKYQKPKYTLKNGVQPVMFLCWRKDFLMNSGEVSSILVLDAWRSHYSGAYRTNFRRTVRILSFKKTKKRLQPQQINDKDRITNCAIKTHKPSVFFFSLQIHLVVVVE